MSNKQFMKVMTKGLSKDGKDKVIARLMTVNESKSVTIDDEFMKSLSPKDAKRFMKNVSKSHGPMFIIDPDADPKTLEYAKWLASTSEGHDEMLRIIITHGLMIIRKIYYSKSNNSCTTDDIINNSNVMFEVLAKKLGMKTKCISEHILRFVNNNLPKLFKNPEEFMMHCNAYLKDQPEAN